MKSVILVLVISEFRNILAIQKGRESDITEFPYIGSYQVLTNSAPSGVRLCTALVVNPTFALTAGRCVIVDVRRSDARVLMKLDVYYPIVIMGVSNISDAQTGAFQRRDIDQLYLHPKAKYALDRPISAYYDIGGAKWRDPLRLNEKYTSGAHFLPPYFPENTDFSRQEIIELLVVQDTICEIPGWGETQFDYSYNKDIPYSQVLLKAKYRLKTKQRFCHYFTERFHKSCLQSIGVNSSISGAVQAEEGRAVTYGDAGGPIVCPYKGKHFVIGMHTDGWTREKFELGWKYEYWIKFDYLMDFMTSIHVVPMSRSQQRTPELGLLLSIVITASSLFTN